MTLQATDEQQAAVDLFATGRSLVVTALAGTGKTSTLKLMAESTQRRGRYCAFNRAIVNDAKARMPSNVIASTLHSLAFGTVGKRFAHRLDNEFGVDVILAALDSMPQPRYADLTVGTAHAVKGLQWPKVVLAGDFPEGGDDISPEELRLLYVAVTRAQRELDISACGLLADQEDESGEAAA